METNDFCFLAIFDGLDSNGTLSSGSKLEILRKIMNGMKLNEYLMMYYLD
jgi:hypothetical protein